MNKDLELFMSCMKSSNYELKDLVSTMLYAVSVEDFVRYYNENNLH